VTSNREDVGSTTNSCEAKRMNLYTQCCDVLFLEFAGQMSLDEGGLGITVSS
jgi:hypothetical protein